MKRVKIVPSSQKTIQDVDLDDVKVVVEKTIKIITDLLK